MAQALSQCLSVQILILYPKGDSSLDSPVQLRCRHRWLVIKNRNLTLSYLLDETFSTYLFQVAGETSISKANSTSMPI